MRTPLLPLCAAIVLAALASCQSEPRPEPWPPPAGTPLALDPTQEIEIAAWWASDDGLLHLSDDRAFVRWRGLNRYAESADRGRWSRRGYATLELESYRTREPERRRAIVTRDEHGLALNVPGLAPLRPLSGPPAAPEDRVIGWYRGAGSALALFADGSFVLEIPSAEDVPVQLAARHGRWTLSGDALVLLPDGTDGRERIVVGVEWSDDSVALVHGEFGRLAREPDGTGPVS